jgi:hypothetical protein
LIDWQARIADDKDPLRQLLETAREWRTPPHVFMGEPVVTTYSYDHAGRVVRSETVQWTAEDRAAALALRNYEAGLCPGCNHPLEETTKPEHQYAYRPDGEPIRCHYCTAQALVSGSDDDKAGLLYPMTLDAEVVELNKQPVPPLPPEFGG